jgi:hypothetical protein
MDFMKSRNMEEDKWMDGSWLYRSYNNNTVWTNPLMSLFEHDFLYFELDNPNL